MADETIWRYGIAVIVLVVGLAFLYGLYRFGIKLFGEQSSKHFIELRDFIMHFGPDSRRGQWVVESAASLYQNYLEKRNDFWEHYGQVAIAVLIVVVLAVLLLTKVISQEAGLPILSAVAGFAIAKSSGSSSNSRRPEPPQG